jgi:hypothetical protein
MAHDEEVRDLGDLESTLPASSVAKEGIRGQLAPPSDAGEGPVVTPAPTCASENPVPAAAPTGTLRWWRSDQLLKTLQRWSTLRRWRGRG